MRVVCELSVIMHDKSVTVGPTRLRLFQLSIHNTFPLMTSKYWAEASGMWTDEIQICIHRPY